MAKYNKIVKDNPKLEMVQISLDQNRGAAEGWAVKDKLPWFTILPADVKSSGLYDYKSTQYVPEYVLVAADGKVVKVKESKVFDEAAKRTK